MAGNQRTKGDLPAMSYFPRPLPDPAHIERAAMYAEGYSNGKAEEVVGTQIRGSLADIDAADAPKIVMAYEPVWAIGTVSSSIVQGEGRGHRSGRFQR